MLPRFVLVSAVLLCLLLTSKRGDCQTITSLSPTSQVAGFGSGLAIAITGTSFGSTQGSSTVKFNGVTAAVNSWSDTSISANVPGTATSGNIVVTVAGVQSNGVNFTVLPSISNPILPSSGPVGSVILVQGAGFGALQGTGSITLNEQSLPVNSWHTNTVSVTLPAGASTGSVVLTTAAGLTVTSPGPLTVVPPPAISNVSPANGAAGTSVTISGSNFGPNTTNRNAKFGGKTATIGSWSDTSIAVTVPSGASTGNIVVTAAGGVASNGVPFTITPAITSLSPASGAVGFFIFISGSSLGSDIGSVSFNGVNSSFGTVWNATSIMAQVPVGATSGDLIVTSSGGTTSNALPFAVLPPPNISSLVPSSGVVGSTVVVSGSDFGATQGTGTITFNGTPVKMASWSDTKITAIVPQGAGTGNVIVTSGNGIGSNGVSFTVSSLSRTIFPSSGAVGDAISVVGTSFGPNQGAGTLTFGGVTISAILWSDSLIKFTVPANAAIGSTQLVVTPSGAATGTALAFSVRPGISSVSPSISAPGASVTIQGSNFGSSEGTSVLTLNGQPIQVSTWSNAQITLAVPSDASSGPLQVTVSNTPSNPVPLNVACTAPVSFITITPSAFSLFPAASSTLQVVNDCGQPLPGVTWISADTTVAVISTDAQPRVIGVSPGTTTITANYSGLTAQATVTTFAGVGFADGTALYSVAPPPDVSVYGISRAVTTSDNPIALLFWDDRPSGRSFRATTLAGAQLWRTDVMPGTQVMGWTPDNQGGLVAEAYDANAGASTYIAVDGKGNQKWNYQTPGFVFTAPAVAPDGTIYVIDPSGGLVALNGETGIPKFYAPLPVGIVGSQPSILADGRVCSTVVEAPFAGVSFDDVPNQPTTLELICVTTSGASSNTVLSTKVSTVQDVFHFHQGSIISDEGGNPVVSWEAAEGPHTGVPTNTSETNVSGPWGTTRLPACLLGAFDDTKPMVLGETGAVYVACHAASPSTSQATLIYSLGSGGGINWTWGVPVHHRLQLQGATAGGGIIAKDITLGSSDLGVAAENIANLSVAGAATPESWSAPAGSNLVYLGDGLLANLGDQSATSPALIIMASTNDADSVWGQTAANNPQQHRGQSAEFVRDQACSGFDETINPRMLMVPANGSNTLKAKLHGKIRPDVQFVSDNQSVTVSPVNPTGDTTTLTITAAAALDPTQTNPVTIKAVSIADPTYSYGSFKVVVKPRLDGNLTMYKITESVRNLTPGSVPTATSLQNYLNNITWGRQVNVFFTVTPSSPVALPVHYDLLPAPNGNGMLDDLTITNTETDAIQDAILAVNPTKGTFANTVVSYVNKFGPPGGVTCAPVPGRACTMIDGQTATGQHLSYVQDPQVADANSRESITAHEVGHGIAIIFDATTPRSENRSLMWKGRSVPDGDPPNPCEIRDREWKRANPTPGDQPVMAH